MPKSEQFDLWPEDAERAREEKGIDWIPQDYANEKPNEPSARTRKKQIKAFLRNTVRHLEEKSKKKNNEK